MPIVRGCNLPDELLYDVENHMWYREAEDGDVELGMTSVATALAGSIVAFTPKRVGRSVKAGKSTATIESGKWVGPARSAVDGEIVAVNEALVGNPSAVNDNPYANWMVRLKPENWEAAKATLTPGPEVGPPYEAKMAADDFPGCE